MHGVDQAERFAERGVVERRRIAGLAHDLGHLTVVFAAVGHGRIGRVRQLEREVVQLLVHDAQRLFLCRELELQLAGELDLLLAFLGRRLADLFGRGVLAGTHAVDLGRQRPADGVETEHLVDQAVAYAFAFDAMPVFVVVAESPQVDHSAVSRICARSDSTHDDACFHARPTARRRSTPASTGPPTGYEPRNFTSAFFAARLRSASAITSSATWPSQSMKKQ